MPIIAAPTADSITKAAADLATGELLGLPTETVYGLAANASNPQAVAHIYHSKGRPSDHPLIVHIASHTNIEKRIAFWADASLIPDYATVLMHAFWPGPCTVVLPRTANSGDFITGHQTTVAIRCPSHPVAQQVLQACYALGVYGVAAPSANRFGRVSPTTAQHVHNEFSESNFLILDGGACEVGIESTIIDCTQASPRILRHGAITADDVARVTGFSVASPDNTSTSHQSTPRVSGSLAAHYAPSTPLRFYSNLDAKTLPETAVYMGFERPNGLRCAYHAMPADTAMYAQQLYATLRTLDTMNYQLIAVQPVPHTPDWAGVADRLSRAAATFSLTAA